MKCKISYIQTLRDSYLFPFPLSIRDRVSTYGSKNYFLKIIEQKKHNIFFHLQLGTKIIEIKATFFSDKLYFGLTKNLA